MLLLSVPFVLAQVLVKGTVKDNLGEGVPGASVQEPSCAVKNAIELKNGKKVEESKVIKSTVIASEDMYSPKNERILFQFVR